MSRLYVAKLLKWEWLSVAAAIAGVVIAILSLLPSLSRPDPQVLSLERERAELEMRLAHATDQNLREVAEIKKQLATLSSIPEQTKVAIQLKDIDTKLDDLKTKSSKLEEVILNSPAKALEVPLLRKDLDNLKDAQQQNLIALRQGIDQIYDLNKWLLGAMAISIVTLALSNLLKGREKSEKPDTQPQAVTRPGPK